MHAPMVVDMDVGILPNHPTQHSQALDSRIRGNWSEHMQMENLACSSRNVAFELLALCEVYPTLQLKGSFRSKDKSVGEHVFVHARARERHTEIRKAEKARHLKY
ncbi:hypothetical protein M5K25_002952 [Dendrobium thyrsiflorum]|uniref:Uncharacterized protein n=1 Tax=Dendrobium thyrsiflorum TaxID=117978 RepID=A0ABD0VNL2_DENTH